MTRNLTTCHCAPWALIRRAGDQEGKRPSTRMAYLTGTIAPAGIAVAMTGYVMCNDMTRWTKSKRRIEWADVIKRWQVQPTAATVRKIKRRMSPVTEATRWNRNTAPHSTETERSR